MVDQTIPRVKTPRATMKDVAALAGVSLKTVSRVINSEPNVNPQLIARVQQAAQELNYQPDIGARSLRRIDRRSLTISALLGDLANPFSAVILRAIEDIAAQRNVSVLGASIMENPDRERNLVKAMSRHRVDGMVIMTMNHDDSFLQQELDAGVAIVYVDRPSLNIEVDTVLSESVDSVRKGVEHIIQHGHRRIAYLGDLSSIATAVDRRRGYEAALKDHSIPLDESLIVMNLRSAKGAGAAVANLLDGVNPPTAIFASQNLLTIGAVEMLQKRNLQHVIAVVGYDDVELADLLDPGLTVIAQNLREIGTTAANLLFERIDGYDGPARNVILPTTFITRGSGEIHFSRA